MRKESNYFEPILDDEAKSIQGGDFNWLQKFYETHPAGTYSPQEVNSWANNYYGGYGDDFEEFENFVNGEDGEFGGDEGDQRNVGVVTVGEPYVTAVGGDFGMHDYGAFAEGYGANSQWVSNGTFNLSYEPAATMNPDFSYSPGYVLSIGQLLQLGPAWGNNTTASTNIILHIDGNQYEYSLMQPVSVINPNDGYQYRNLEDQIVLPEGYQGGDVRITINTGVTDGTAFTTESYDLWIKMPTQ
ncbi:hypothetical protein ACR789_25975 [Sphingobacterium siyangense]|jgi:hypothetical protein|uniref:hypothetical protein n=1 Tax=Sphingobacterium TaxID=28453 RepID=UPI0028AB4CB4|nr:hypothetical protein [Sphingobacterium multivorum]